MPWRQALSSVVSAAPCTCKCLSSSLVAHHIGNSYDHDEINHLIFSMEAANKSSCLHAGMFGYNGSAFCVSPKKMVKKSITVKNKLLSKSKINDETFSGTGLNITNYDMFKSIELPLKRKMHQEKEH